MKILISPFTKPHREGKKNGKDYPHWDKLINLLKVGNEITQIGLEGERQLVDNFQKGKSMAELLTILDSNDAFISVDNFFPHLANTHRPDKTGVVLFGPSNPDIFGYPQNFNIYNDRKYFRIYQFDIWEAHETDDSAHVDPLTVLLALRKLKKSLVM